MHCNDLNCGDHVDFYYITKSFCSMKVKFLVLFVCFLFFFFGGGGLIFGPLVQKIRIWVVMGSNGLEIDSMTPKTPDNMYHT